MTRYAIYIRRHSLPHSPWHELIGTSRSRSVACTMTLKDLAESINKTSSYVEEHLDQALDDIHYGQRRESIISQAGAP